MTASVSVAYVQSVLDYVEQAGGDIRSLMTATGLTRATLDDTHARVPAALFAQLFDAAAALLGEPDLGLKVGAAIKPGHYGVLGYVVMSCDTLADALARHLRYQALVADIGEARLEPVDGGRLRLRWVTEVPPTRQLAEHNLAGWVTYARWITANASNPDLVLLPHARPASPRVHESIFRCPVRFETGQTALEFPASLLSTRIAQADPGLRAQMDRYAHRLLDEYARETTLEGRLRHWLRKQLTSGGCQLESAASVVELTPRTLQRRLAEEGWTFNRLIDDTRKELALDLMTNEALSGAELAFMLGFSDQTAFTRAFRRWFGMTPGQARDDPRQLLVKSGEPGPD